MELQKYVYTKFISLDAYTVVQELTHKATSFSSIINPLKNVWCPVKSIGSSQWERGVRKQFTRDILEERGMVR